MIIIDFLVFNLTNWYKDHPDRLKWSTAVGRATYVVGLITIMWIFNFWMIINVILHPTVTFGFGSIPLAVAGIASMQFYKYIYESKGRYERMCSAANTPLNVSDKVGQALSIGFTFFSLFVSVLLIVFFS
jgi:fatty acid desaturase